MFALRRTSHGGIAQLGERLNGIQEVGGSNPPISTMNITEPVTDRLFFIACRNSGVWDFLPPMPCLTEHEGTYIRALLKRPQHRVPGRPLPAAPDVSQQDGATQNR